MISFQTISKDAVRAIQRLGIMGGSFDPIHIAHLIVAETVRERLDLDKVLFVPAGKQPLKTGRPVTPAAHRVAMVELAIRDNPCFALSRVDVDRKELSYTSETVKLIRNEWGEADTTAMWLIVGADSLSTFPTWHEPVSILAECRLAALRRPGTTVDMSLLRAHLPEIEGALDWVDAPLVDISSTDLRHRIADGRSIKYRVPEPVREYVEANGLYR